MPAAMTATGSAVACKETAKPAMMLLAWLVTATATNAAMTTSGSAKTAEAQMHLRAT
jgi:hypothetical protein